MEQLLKQFNFSKPEIKVYQQLLKSGGATVSEVAKKTKLRRTSCQEVIRSLEEMGFIIASKRGNILFYQTEDPDKFWQIANERKFVVDRLVVELDQKQKIEKWSVRTIGLEETEKILKRAKRKKTISKSFDYANASIITIGDKIILYSSDKKDFTVEIISSELTRFHDEFIK